MSFEITSDKKDRVETACPTCDGRRTLWMPGAGRIDCPCCDGIGKVFVIRGDAERDRTFFRRIFHGDL